MIITGGYRTHVLTQQAPELTCESCGQMGAIDFQVFSKCVHLFFVPLLPVGKAGHLSCRNCHAHVTEAEMPSELKQRFSAAMSAAHSPWWQFSGVAIFGILLFMPWSLLGNTLSPAEQGPVPVLEANGEDGPSADIPYEPYEKDSSDRKFDFDKLHSGDDREELPEDDLN